MWRRRWDSNPRDGFPSTPLAGERLRPLGHVSADGYRRASVEYSRRNPGSPVDTAGVLQALVKAPKDTERHREAPAVGKIWSLPSRGFAAWTSRGARCRVSVVASHFSPGLRDGPACSVPCRVRETFQSVQQAPCVPQIFARGQTNRSPRSGGSDMNDQSDLQHSETRDIARKLGAYPTPLLAIEDLRRRWHCSRSNVDRFRKAHGLTSDVPSDEHPLFNLLKLLGIDGMAAPCASGRSERRRQKDPLGKPSVRRGFSNPRPGHWRTSRGNFSASRPNRQETGYSHRKTLAVLPHIRRIARLEELSKVARRQERRCPFPAPNSCVKTSK